MRALTLTQPWAGLVASGIKLVENRQRTMIKREDFGERFAIHASREIAEITYERIAELAPELTNEGRWFELSRVRSAVIAVGVIDKVFAGSWDAETIAEHADALSYSNGEKLGPDQVRWFFGPVGYVLRDVIALPTPVPCRGWQGYWTLNGDTERAVMEQLA